jgi:hypothetical protein
MAADARGGQSEPLGELGHGGGAVLEQRAGHAIPGAALRGVQRRLASVAGVASVVQLARARTYCFHNVIIA